MEPLSELAEYSEMKKVLTKEMTPISVIGCMDSQKVHLMAGMGEGFRYRIILTYNDMRAREIAEDYKFYDRNVVVFPAKDLIFYQADIHGNQLTMQRIQVLKRIMEEKPTTVGTTFQALMSPMMPIDLLKKRTISVSVNGEMEEETLSRELVEMGYEKVYQVEAPGQFSIRGGIIDIFDLTQENPYRVELWGEEVESIRSFDVESQRSIETLTQVQIFPAREMILSAERKEQGMQAIEAEAEKQYDLFRAQFKTEEAHRIKQQVKELKEDLFTFQSMTNLDSYLHYFYGETGSLLDFMEADKRWFSSEVL